MSHHESELSDELKEALSHLRNIDEGEPLGATGRFPEGKLTTHDEGEIKFSVGAYKGKVVINFGKPIMSLGMNVKQARELANLLRKWANEIKKGHA